MAPLDGIRVLDFTAAMAGPTCTMLLGDFGAEVTKVEPPGGESSRTWGRGRFGEGGFSALFLALNRNKVSVTLDLKSDVGRARALELARESDVLVESFRPGVADRLGIGYEAVASLKPDVVYCSISGFGQTGPLRDRPGYDQQLQAYAGHLSITGEPGRPSVRIGPSAIDLLTGAHAAYGIVLALRERDRSGTGQRVETSLYDSSIHLITQFLADYTGSGRLPGKQGGGFAFLAPYGMFQARDREFYMGVGSDRMFEELCGAIGRGDLAADARFARRLLRARHPGERRQRPCAGRGAGAGARAGDDRRHGHRRRPHGRHPGQARADSRQHPPRAAGAGGLMPVAVAGIGTIGFGAFPDESVASMASRAVSAALADCGLERRQLDGLLVHIGSPRGLDYDELALLLGLDVRFAAQTWSHGRFTATVLLTAALALDAGLADHVLCVGAFKNTAFTRVGTTTSPSFFEGMREGGGPHAETPWVGLAAPAGGAALALRRYLHRYGLDRERLGAIAIAQRRAAQANPLAASRKPLTQEEYEASPFVVEPLRLLDCSYPVDTACAVILTRSACSASRASTRARTSSSSASPASASTRQRCSTTARLARRSRSIAPPA